MRPTPASVQPDTPTPIAASLCTAPPETDAAVNSDDWRLLEPVIRALSAPALDDLCALLAGSVTFPSAAERRQQSLGRLLLLLTEREGEVPTVTDYENARDPSDPAASTLTELYGSWVDAIAAAAKHLTQGSAARIPDSYRARSHKGGYTPAEVAAAINRCRRATGTTPTERQFDAFCLTERQLAGRFKRAIPRAPTRKAWRKACGTWENALNYADGTPQLGPRGSLRCWRGT